MNLSYHFDSFLCEVFDDPVAANGFLQNERKRLLNVDPDVSIKIMSDLGLVACILGKLVEAELLLEKALREFSVTSLDNQSLIRLSLRYAHVLQRQKRFAESNQIIAQAVERCEKEPELQCCLDLAYQRSGQNLFDQGDYQSALRFFDKARQLREGLATDRLNRTLAAIEIVRGAMDLADK